MRQLDWLTEYYKIPNIIPTGVNIWYRKEEDEPDLVCDVFEVKGQYINFYVINGDWYGRLDMAAKLITVYCPFGDSVVPYVKCEFIYEEEDND